MVGARTAVGRSRHRSWRARWSTSPAGPTGSRRFTWHWRPGVSSPRIAPTGLGAVGIRGLPVRHLVAAHSPGGPVLAAAVAAAGGSRRPGGRLGRNRAWSILLGTIMTIALVTNLTYISTALAGLNEWTGDLDFLAPRYPQTLESRARFARHRAAERTPVPCWSARRPCSTSITVDLQYGLQPRDHRAPGQRQERSRVPRRPPATRNLTHIYVDWKEIQRHRKPGGYGFTDFVQPERFAALGRGGRARPTVATSALMQELYHDSLGLRPRSAFTSTDHSSVDIMDDLTVVTGGAGFIGSHLVAQLVDSGQQVRVIERPGAVSTISRRTAQVFFADIRDRAALWRGPWKEHAGSIIWRRIPICGFAIAASSKRSTIKGTINVLDAALAAGARADSSHQYREYPDQGECERADRREHRDFAGRRGGPLLPVEAAGRAICVFSGEQGAAGRRRQSDDAGRARRSRAVAADAADRRFLQGSLPATMDCTLNLIDVRDVALGLSRVMERGQPGRRYLLGHCNLTLDRSAGRAGRIDRRAGSALASPVFGGIAAAWVSELIADHLTGRAPKATLTGVRLAKRIMHFDASRSLAELGLEPRSIRESLADAIVWLRVDRSLPASRRRLAAVTAESSRV